MTTPLALLFYEKLLPGSQLVNRLEDLGYQVVTHTEAATLLDEVKETKPFLMIVDLAGPTDLSETIRALRANLETAHIPVLAFAKDDQQDRRASAHAAGATLVAGDTAVLNHLPQLLQQVLEMES
jgi:CheY-like chemotaxis protein